MSKPQIMLVEDDDSLGQTLQLRLAQEYKVHWAHSKSEALVTMEKNQELELLILDVGLPDGTGFEIAKLAQTSQKKPGPAIVFLTAQSDPESRLQGYELGALEYIPKPFHLQELLLRVKKALASRAGTQVKPPNLVKLENCEIDLVGLSIRRASGQIEYPPVNDMRVLILLIEKSPSPVSRDEIMNSVWGVDKNPSIRTIDNTIVRLRQILGDSGEKHIRSVRGLGYQWQTASAN